MKLDKISGVITIKNIVIKPFMARETLQKEVKQQAGDLTFSYAADGEETFIIHLPDKEYVFNARFKSDYLSKSL